MSGDTEHEALRYGLSDPSDREGELILWEKTDSTPFTHVAVVLDHAAFDRYLEHRAASYREAFDE